MGSKVAYKYIGEDFFPVGKILVSNVEDIIIILFKENLLLLMMVWC